MSTIHDGRRSTSCDRAPGLSDNCQWVHRIHNHATTQRKIAACNFLGHDITHFAQFVLDMQRGNNRLFDVVNA